MAQDESGEQQSYRYIKIQPPSIITIGSDLLKKYQTKCKGQPFSGFMYSMMDAQLVISNGIQAI